MGTTVYEKLAFKVIDLWLKYCVQYGDLPGIQVCVRKKGDIIFSNAYGYANAATKRPLTTQDLFHIASHSKTFTSCVVLKLLEEGWLRLEDKVIDYLPEFKSHPDSRFRKITIRDLLSHRAGIMRDGVDASFYDLLKPFPSRQDIRDEILSAKLVFGPNEVSKYSNLGFSVLGPILEHITGLPYPRALEKFVLNNLKGTRIFPDYPGESTYSFADGHSGPFFERKRLPLKHAAASAFAPAAGVCATAEDTSLFFYTVLCGKGLLKDDMRKELLSLQWSVPNIKSSRYGLGVVCDTSPDMELIGHSGSYPGFATDTVWWKGSGYVVSLFTNANKTSLNQLTRGLIQILIKIKDMFTESEAKKAMVTAPLMSKWMSFVCVLTPTRGLCLPLDTSLPVQDSFVLTSKDGKEFFNDTQNGYYALGEPIVFFKNNKGIVTCFKWGPHSLYPEEVFLENLRETIISDH